MKMVAVAALVALVATPGITKAADEWGIEHEQVSRLEAKVVDIVCELTGDCPAECGAGKRQLGLLKDDGTLLLVGKNNEAFAGATADLVAFCGQRVTADGLFIDDPLMPLFASHFKRLAPDGNWSRANQFTKDWAADNGFDPKGKEVGQWFRHDPAVKQKIAEDGVFGIPGLKPEE